MPKTKQTKKGFSNVILAAIFILNIIPVVWALSDVVRSAKYTMMTKAIWVAIILVFQSIGAIIYYLAKGNLGF